MARQFRGVWCLSKLSYFQKLLNKCNHLGVVRRYLDQRATETIAGAEHGVNVHNPKDSFLEEK